MLAWSIWPAGGRIRRVHIAVWLCAPVDEHRTGYSSERRMCVLP
jgi:hypothetical protein